MGQAVSTNFPRTRSDGLVLMTALAADDVTIGDHLWRDVSQTPDAVRPASALPDAGNLLQNQQRFAKEYVGVAVAGKRADDDLRILVDTNPVGEFRRQVASGTFEVGSFLAPAVGVATALADQVLAVVSGEKDALYVVTQRGATVTEAIVRPLRGQGSALGTGGIFGQVTTRTLTGDLVLTAGAFHAGILFLDPGGAGRNVDIPNANLSFGRVLVIVNEADAAETLTVREPGPTTVATIDQNEAGFLVSNGVVWRSIVGTNT